MTAILTGLGRRLSMTAVVLIGALNLKSTIQVLKKVNFKSRCHGHLSPTHVN